MRLCRVTLICLTQITECSHRPEFDKFHKLSEMAGCFQSADFSLPYTDAFIGITSV